MVGLAVTRYLVVSKPFNGAKYRKVEFGNRVCTIVLIAAIIFNIPRWFHHMDLHKIYQTKNDTENGVVLPESQYLSPIADNDDSLRNNILRNNSSVGDDSVAHEYIMMGDSANQETQQGRVKIKRNYMEEKGHKGNAVNATLETMVGSCIAERRKLLPNLLIPEYAYLGKNPYYRWVNNVN